MEVIRADHLAGLLGLAQEQDRKEARWQALQLVHMARTEAKGLPEEYLSQQGPPFSNNGAAIPREKMDDLPDLDQNYLPSLSTRLTRSLRAFLSLSEWLAAVLLWQRELNPKAWELLNLLETAENNSRAISSNLTGLLGRQEVSSPSLTQFSKTMKKKAAGYLVCKCFCEWLEESEKCLTILLGESSV